MQWLSRFRKKWLTWLHDNSGVAAVLTALVMIFLLGFAAIVFDVGHVMVARTELQNAADAAALAGARGYFLDPALPPDTPDCTRAALEATNFVNLNYADTHVLSIAPEDIQTGVWHWATSKFEPTGSCSYEPNPDTQLAVQVTVRKRPGALNNNPVAMTLARVVGVTEMPVDATAVAVNELPQGSNPPCGVSLFAISECAANKACASADKKYPIKFGPDGSDTGGWATFNSKTPPASILMCQAYSLCGSVIPSKTDLVCDPSTYCEEYREVTNCDTNPTLVNANNGVVDSVLQALAESLIACGSLTIRVPVVQAEDNDDCTGVQWVQSFCLKGYVDFVIDPAKGGFVNPGANPEKWVPNPISGIPNGGIAHEIGGYVKCEGDWGDGQGSPNPADYYGTLSRIPKLVK